MRIAALFFSFFFFGVVDYLYGYIDRRGDDNMRVLVLLFFFFRIIVKGLCTYLLAWGHCAVIVFFFDGG